METPEHGPPAGSGNSDQQGDPAERAGPAGRQDAPGHRDTVRHEDSGAHGSAGDRTAGDGITGWHDGMARREERGRHALAGKVALVTGSGQGIGQGIALALAAEGVDVAVVGRTREKLKATCAMLTERGVRAEPFVLDVLKTDEIPGVVDAVAAGFGGVDILVNNAYSGAFGRLLDLDDRAFQKGFVSGPFAAFAFMKACHPHLVRRGGGDIVNLVTTAMVRWDTTTYGPYAAAKQALRSLTRTAAVEWGPDGIRCHSIAPHARSPALEWWTQAHPAEAADFVRSIPLGRIGECEDDIGRAVTALLDPDLRYLTGATVPLDGGQGFFG